MIHTYITLDFLQTFFEAEPKIFLLENDQIWLQMYHLLAKADFQRYLDVLPEELVKQSQKDKLGIHSKELLKILVDHYYSDRRLDIKELKECRHIEPFSYIFSKSDKNSYKNLGYYSCDSYSEKVQINLLLKKKTLSISKVKEINRLKNWDELNRYVLPFHSMIVADNYLLTEISSVSKYLKTLLSNNKHVTHLTLVANLLINKDNKRRNGDNNEVIIEKRQKAENSFNEICKNLIELNVKVSIILFNHSNEFHDRIIITNCQILTSGNSLHNYFYINGTSKLNSPTLLSIASLVNRQDEFSYSIFANQILSLFKDKIASESYVKFGNPENNPLFMLKSPNAIK